MTNTINGTAGGDLISGDTNPNDLNDLIFGHGGNDTILANNGNDTIWAGTGNDSVRGGKLNDTIYGEADNDTIYGDKGNDYIEGGLGHDIIHGGDGNDFINGNGDNDTIYGDAGDDTLHGGKDQDFLDGGAGNDSISSDKANDTLFGSSGNDTLNGGEGIDVAKYLGDASDYSFNINVQNTVITDNITTNGNDGVDQLFGIEILEFANNEKYDWDSGSNTWIKSGGSNPTSTTGISLFGTDFNDTLTGTEFNDSIHGQEGDDIIYGLGGDDTLVGGNNSNPYINDNYNTIHGGSGNDEISTVGLVYGGTGNDTIKGTGEFYGGDGDDIITTQIKAYTGTYGNILIENSVNGGTGNDYIEGITYGDTVDGGTGNDTLSLSSKFQLGGWLEVRRDSVTNEIQAITEVKNVTVSNIDVILTSDKFAFIRMGSEWVLNKDSNKLVSSKLLEATTEEVFINGVSQGTPTTGLYMVGGSGNDDITGGAFNDEIFGEDGNDTIRAGSGSDTIWGGNGHDLINGNGGNDTVNGEAGDDVLYGGKDNDIFDGGIGNDTLIGNKGNDFVEGGAGNDVVIFNGFISNYTIAGNVITDNTGYDGIDTISGIEKLQFIDANLIFDGVNSVWVEENYDPLLNTLINDQNTNEDAIFNFNISSNFVDPNNNSGTTIYNNTDVLTYSATLADGSALPSWLSFNSTTGLFSGTPLNPDLGIISVKVTADDGNGGTAEDIFDIDVQTVIPAMNVINGTSLSETINGTAGDDSINGQDGNDTINASDGDDVIDGGNGNDYLEGEAGQDIIYGDNGDDTIIGGNAHSGSVGDTLTGGLGKDIFLFKTQQDSTIGNTDIITDFEQGSDWIDVSALGINKLSDLTITQDTVLGITSVTKIYDTLKIDLNGVFTLTKEDFGIGDVNDGTAGDDYITGTDFADTIDSYTGNDTIIGLGGDDLIGGNAGTDIIIYRGNVADYDITYVGNSLSEISHKRNIDIFNDGNDSVSLDADYLQFTDEVLQYDGNVSWIHYNYYTIVATNIADQSVLEDALFNFDISSNFSDSDVGDILTYSATLADGSALPSWLSFNIATGLFSGTPLNADVGTISVKVTADDGKGNGTVNDIFDIVVNNTNDAPIVNNAIADDSATVDSSFSMILASNVFTDVDGDALSLSATLADGSALPAWLSFDANTKTFSGTPIAGNEGIVSVKVTADDGNGGTVDDIFDINVQAAAPAMNVINGTSASETINGTAGDDSINGDLGDDWINTNGGNDQVYGGDGKDTVIGANGAELIYGNDGDDYLASEGGNDTIYGGAGNDFFSSGGTGSDDDYLVGEAGNDHLRSGAGNDTLIGGIGADLFNGGSGNDTFVYEALTDSTTTSMDIIEDFSAGYDILDLSAITSITSLSDLTISTVSWNTRVDDNSSDFSIELTGSVGLTASDFIF